MRSFLNCTLAVIAALAVSSCGGPTPKRPASGSVSVGALQTRAVDLSFAEYFSVATVDHAFTRIDFDDPADWRYLTSGWYGLEKDESGNGFAWIKGRNAVVEVPLVASERIRLRLQLSPLPKANQFPQQNVKVLWNGAPLATLPVVKDDQDFEIPIPAEAIRTGPNRIELQPSYWVKPAAIGMGSDLRDLGVKVSKIELLKESPSSPDNSDPPARLDDGDIVQAPDSVITYYFKPPENAKLHGEAILEIPDGMTSTQGFVVISLLDSEGGMHELQRRELEELVRDGRFGFEVNLSEWPSRRVAISLAFSAPPAPNLSLHWKDVALSGMVTEPGEPDLDALRDRYNILVVLFDTLRADHTRLYHREGVETRNFARLARSGATFSRAQAEAPWTRPSVTSLFTSLPPLAHGVLSDDLKLSPDLPYLPEVLQKDGYRTVAIFNNATISSTFGYDRGFDDAHDFFKIRDSVIRKDYRTPESQAEYVWDNYIEPAASSASDQPFFVYLHEIDPHSPFEPLPPYDGISGTDYHGNIDVSGSMKMFYIMNSQPSVMPEPERRYLQSQYKGEVLFMDAYLGALLERLRKSGLERETLVVFLSDHGEEFFDHGGQGHGYSLYEELLRVPMIFRLPGVVPEGPRSTSPAQLADIAPTLLDLIGAEAPATFLGRSLLPDMIAPTTSDFGRPVFGHTVDRVSNIFAPQPLESIRHGKWKLIQRDLAEAEKGKIEYELYNLLEDPKETLNLWGKNPLVGNTLRQTLQRRALALESLDLSAAAQVRPEDLTPEAIKNLKDLGYL